MNKQAINAIRNRGQGGFTLIELIVVIVILGILAATALPRFLDLGGDARQAALSGARGAIHSASSLVHAKVLMTPSATTDVDMEGVKVNLKFGYPAADKTMLQAAGIETNEADFKILVGPANGANDPAVSAGQIAIVPKSVADSAKAKKCYVLYAEAAAAGGSPVISTDMDTCK